MSFIGKQFDDEGSVVSVGKSMVNGAVYNSMHPAYIKLAAAVTAEVSALAERDTVRRERANPVVMTVVLDSKALDEVSSDYPELRILNYGIDRPGHSLFVASVSLANEYVLMQACKVASSVVHLGGSVLSSLLRSGVDVHVEVDPTSPGALHARQRDVRNTGRVMGDYATLSADIGMNSARVQYEKYIRQEAHVVCTRSSSCATRAEAYCADLARNAMSLPQFCAGMRQCDAEVGFGFFIYHPSMLVSDEGEIPGTGIWFKRGVSRMSFRYPEGLAGVESYSLEQWASFITEHVVTVGVGKAAVSYHMQLGKPRGPFMFFQVTRVVGDSDGVELRHALDIPMEGQYMVSSWVLKDLVSDPSAPGSWGWSVFLAPVKIVDKLFAFGMQARPEDFSRYALRKQLKIYDRVTVEGSVVTKGFNPTREQVDALVTALHAELFVKRYESSQLSRELMSRLKAVSAFGSASTATRVAAVAAWGMTHMWDVTLGAVGEAIVSMCEWIEAAFGGPQSRLPQFTIAPTYVAFESTVSTWRIARAARFIREMDVLGGFSTAMCNGTIRGGLIATSLAGVTAVAGASVAAAARSVTAVGPAMSVHTKHVELADVSQSITQVRPAMDVGAMRDLEDALVSELRVLNEIDEAPADRHNMITERVVRVAPQTLVMQPDYDEDPDYVGTMNDVYEEFNPGVAQANLVVDTASLVYDDQDRNLVAEYLKLPRLMDTVPKDRKYYKSKILALGAPKRQETVQELLSSAAARTLAAPKISLPQDESVIIPQIWDKFLDTMCIGDARDKLAKYRSDPVALEETAYRDWMAQAKPDTLKAIRRELEVNSKSLGEMDVGDYIMMLKSDVKPPISDKPLRARIEPQVIVYHEKPLSAMYSSIFRVLVRRFLSLLRPEVHVNLLKDTKDIGEFIQANHPFGELLTYLENDFSKYDKSQDAFVFALEEYVFRQLGMNEAMLQKWVDGHVDCSIRSFTTGISLHVRYQRKSGDATTAFGNVILNILSVCYAYSPSGIVWAVFMGDDSLVACNSVGTVESAVGILAEVFNLSAKMYVTDAPYFASHFVVLNDGECHAAMVPDPLKWIEKRSQPIAEDAPMWRERWVSAADSCGVYRYKLNTDPLARMVAERYGLSASSAARLPAAIATAISTEEKYRACYEEVAEIFHY